MEAEIWAPFLQKPCIHRSVPELSLSTTKTRSIQILRRQAGCTTSEKKKLSNPLLSHWSCCISVFSKISNNILPYRCLLECMRRISLYKQAGTKKVRKSQSCLTEFPKKLIWLHLCRKRYSHSVMSTMKYLLNVSFRQELNHWSHPGPKMTNICQLIIILIILVQGLVRIS